MIPNGWVALAIVAAGAVLIVLLVWSIMDHARPDPTDGITERMRAAILRNEPKSVHEIWLAHRHNRHYYNALVLLYYGYIHNGPDSLSDIYGDFDEQS